MGHQAKFSIITPSFNQGRYIRDTVESVQRQNYSNFEHIIIDGGSTDETLAVIQSYPHLQWVSEPDKGQSDALNKGFSKATGEIIGWLNSDDWYADNIFNEVALALEQYPIVIGACELRDGENKTIYNVENHTRTWFDMLKYWVPYSIPAQPSIFIRRELLESVKRPDGTYVDPDLHYCMDYDLWMRISQSFPLTNRINRVLSYYRMSGENKTGQGENGMSHAEPEMSRVYNRYKDSPLTIERTLSMIIPATSAAEISVTLESLAAQSLPSGEIVCINYSQDSTGSKEISKLCASLNSRMLARGRNFHFRQILSSGDSYLAALNEGINSSSSSLIAYIDPHYTADSSLVTEIISLFTSDRIGLALPIKSNHSALQGLRNMGSTVDINQLLSIANLPRAFVARKIGLVEIDGFDESLSINDALRKIIHGFSATGWEVNVDNKLRIVERREQ